MIKAIFLSPDITADVGKLSHHARSVYGLSTFFCKNRNYLKTRQELGFGCKEVLVVDNDSDGIFSAVEARCRTWKFDADEDLTVHNLETELHRYDNPL